MGGAHKLVKPRSERQRMSWQLATQTASNARVWWWLDPTTTDQPW